MIGGKELSEAKILALRDILRLAVTATETELLVAGRILAQLLASVSPAQTFPDDPAPRSPG